MSDDREPIKVRMQFRYELPGASGVDLRSDNLRLSTLRRIDWPKGGHCAAQPLEHLACLVTGHDQKCCDRRL
jgi:hypothetical protein